MVLNGTHMSENGAVRKWLPSVGFDALAWRQWKRSLFNACCIYTDRRNQNRRTDLESVLFSQENASYVHTSRKFLMPLRACSGGVICDQSSPMKNRLLALTCSVQQLTWNEEAFTWNGEEMPNLNNSLPVQFHVLVFKKTVLSLVDSPASGKNLLQICFGNTTIWLLFFFSFSSFSSPSRRTSLSRQFCLLSFLPKINK